MGARMNLQYALCLMNAWVSIKLYGTAYFHIILSITVTLLVILMQLTSVKCNGIYKRLEYGNRDNSNGMVIFYIFVALMVFGDALFIATGYTNWIAIQLDVAFSIYWNFMLFTFLASHCYHCFVFWKISRKSVYSDAQMKASFNSFREMYDYRAAGFIHRCLTLLVWANLLVFGNVFQGDYTFYLAAFPACMFVLQFSNFQRDYRNAFPLPHAFKEWFNSRAQESFDQAFAAMRLRERQRKMRRTKDNTSNTSHESEATAA